MADAKQVYRARPTSAEVAEVLAGRLVATVGTRNGDGSIHLAYVLFLHPGWAALLRDVVGHPQGPQRGGRRVGVHDRAGSRVDRAEPDGRGRGHGQGGPRRRTTSTTGCAPSTSSRRRWTGSTGPGELDDVAVETTPVTWRSWTGSVLHEQTQRELAVAYEDAWLADDE